MEAATGSSSILSLTWFSIWSEIATRRNHSSLLEEIILHNFVEQILETADQVMEAATGFGFGRKIKVLERRDYELQL